MGTQFWWFFDVALAAIVLVMIFLGAKRGFSKTITVLIGFIVSIVVGTAASGSVSDFFYESAVKQGNIKHIEEGLSKNDVVQKTKSYIEGLGYNVKVNESKLKEIFSKGGDVRDPLYTYLNNINGRTVDEREAFYVKITEGFAEIMDAILSENVSDYVGETTADQIISKPAEFGDTLKAIVTEDNEETGVHNEAAAYIEEHYASAGSKEMIKLMTNVIICLVLVILSLMIVHKYNGNGTNGYSMELADRIIGAVTGIAVGAATIFILTIAVRLLVIFGSNEMLLFNSETIDKTFVFKHIYNLIVKM